MHGAFSDHFLAGLSVGVRHLDADITEALQWVEVTGDKALKSGSTALTKQKALAEGGKNIVTVTNHFLSS